MRQLRVFALLIGLMLASSAFAELRVYDVKDQYRQEIYQALRGVLTPQNGPPIGQVTMLPTGQFLIDTSAATHEQVAAILEQINDYQAEPTPRVTLRYWAVLGVPEGSANATAEQGSPVPEVLSDVLNELREVYGDLRFRLLGTASLVTESGGQIGSVEGQVLSIRQNTWLQGETLNAELAVSFIYTNTSLVSRPQANGSPGEEPSPFTTFSRQPLSISLRTSIARDEFVVVGENTIRQSTTDQGDLNGTIFYIVHWPAGN